MDLAATADNVRVRPAVRRRAEQILVSRLQNAALGERVALARRATRSVIAVLLESRDAEVLEALVQNPRLLEAEALRLARRLDAPPRFLRRFSEVPDWCSQGPVRTALLRNPRTPVAAALRLVASLTRRQLRDVADDPRMPAIVRIGAERRLTASSRAS